MKSSPLYSSAVLLGAVAFSIAGAAHSFAQANRAKPATHPVTSVLPNTRDTGTSSTSAATDPVGFTTSNLLANSDSLISIPFTRPVAFSGLTTAISGNVITVSSSANLGSLVYGQPTAAQTNTYYAIIGPNLTTVSGTVSVTNGLPGVTATAGFSGIVAGDELTVNGLAYNVASVTSDTALTLSRAYAGTTASGLTATYDHSPKEGSYYPVTANTANTVTVNLNGDSLSTVAVGTSISVIPYWTLGTAFPSTDAGTSYTASTGTGPRSFQTQILLPDLTHPGINLPSSSSYVYYNGAWILEGTDGSVSYNNTVILPPTSYFTVRNAGTATTFTPTGGVYMNRISLPLDTQSTSAQDNAVALPRPTNVALNDLGLITSGAFVVSTGTGPRSITDTLLVYDNSSAVVNKPSAAGYYYFNGGWRLVGSDGTVDYGTTTIAYGTGYTIRKGVTASGATSFWQNTRTY